MTGTVLGVGKGLGCLYASSLAREAAATLHMVAAAAQNLACHSEESSLVGVILNIHLIHFRISISSWLRRPSP